MICADMDASFGDSTCVECGTCLQVCPTGALVDRKSAYMGRNVQIERTASACTGCAVGCQTQVVTRAGHPLRVEGEWSGPNGGVLCQRGRFEPLAGDRARVAAPLIRKGGALTEATLDEAIEMIAGRMRAAGGKGTKAWTTAAMLDAELAAFASTFTMSGADMGVLEAAPAAAEVLEGGGTLADLDTCDYILVAGGDPIAVAPVLGYRRQARLLSQGAGGGLGRRSNRA